MIKYGYQCLVSSSAPANVWCWIMRAYHYVNPKPCWPTPWALSPSPAAHDPVWIPIRSFILWSGRCLMRNCVYTALSRSRAMVAISLTCASPLRRGNPDTTMYASPIVSTWNRKSRGRMSCNWKSCDRKWSGYVQGMEKIGPIVFFTLNDLAKINHRWLKPFAMCIYSSVWHFHFFLPFCTFEYLDLLRSPWGL